MFQRLAVSVTSVFKLLLSLSRRCTRYWVIFPFDDNGFTQRTITEREPLAVRIGAGTPSGATMQN